MKAPFFICVLISVLSRGIEPRPPPSEGDILSIKLQERCLVIVIAAARYPRAR